MSSFLFELWLTGKPYTVSFKQILLYSSFVKSFDMLPKQKLYQHLLYHLSHICKSMFYLHTGNSHHYYNVDLGKILSFNTNFFSTAPLLALLPLIGPSPGKKKLFL